MRKYCYLLLLATLLLGACHTSWHLSTVDRSRLLIDSRYDNVTDDHATAFLRPYRQQVDSIMRPVVGSVSHYMAVARPESDLSDLLADIMVWGGEAFQEHPDFGVYNMGGIRAALAKGEVTYGDVLDVAPFENHICFLTLSGENTLQLFREMAAVGGEGVSHSVRLVITRDGQLKSATINGQPVDANKSYRVATLDYLAQGNDKLEAFKSKTNVVSPQEEAYDVRYIICNYFKTMAQKGITVDAKVEGRITYEN